jgi:Ca-activated chloride channel family protein
MEFGNPKWLWGLLLLPAVAFWLAYGERRGRSALEAFTGKRLCDALAPGRSWRKALAKGLLQTAALGLVVVAMAAPRFGVQLVKVEREGIDIVIALDTSLSMLAEDMLPSRLERAKQEIVDLIKGLSGDRVGLVAFAGSAHALCPLTVDYDAALMLARAIDVYMVSEPGTAIGKAITTSTALFDPSVRRDRAIILVTDGENHEGDPLQAAAEAREAGIRIFTIGIGEPKGELIPERGTDGAVAGYKKDRRGETVLTQLDEGTLQRVAETSGGKYLPATREGLELAVLYDEIAGMERKKIKGEFVERKKERFWIFLLVAGSALALDAVVGTRAAGMRRRARTWLHTGVPVLLALLGATATAADARTVDRGKVRAGNRYFDGAEYDKAIALYREAMGDTLEPRRWREGVFYNEGNALYMQERYGEAIARYQRSFADDTTLTGKMLYNRANALMRAGDPGAAVESYVQALRTLPDDEAARHNLEIALRALRERQQQQQQQQQQGGDGEQGDAQDEGERQPRDDQQALREPSGDGEQQPQEGEPDPQEAEGQRQQPQPDSTQTPEPMPDSTFAAPPPISPEQMEQLSLEDAMRILQALEEQERKLQQERRRAAFQRLRGKGKDW